MGQEQYNIWVQTTSPNQQDNLCGGTRVSTNELYFLEKYGKKYILDIGCGTGHRTFPAWLKKHWIFCGIEKFTNLITGSNYKDAIIEGDICSEEFNETLEKVKEKLNLSETDKFDISFLLGGVINGFIDNRLQNVAFTNLKKLSLSSDYILIDTLTHFDLFDIAERGQILQLFHLVPPQYFYSKSELMKIIENNSLDIIEQKDEHIGHLKRTHYLLTMKKN